MPKGRFPYRRTLEYLSSLPVYLKDSVKAVAVYYNSQEQGSSGARQVPDRQKVVSGRWQSPETCMP